MIREFLALLSGVRKAGENEWTARCPAHNDRRSSLSVGAAVDRILVNCHAGCTPEQIVVARDLTLADLFYDHGPRTTPTITATYDYGNEAGALLYQVCRLDPKGFRCRRPDGGGGWLWDLKGVRAVPYRLHTLAEAPRVFIAEGEKDCDSLARVGLIATCNHGGAGKWREEHTRALVAAAVPEVVVLRDNDRPGAAHQDAVVRSCIAAGLRVKRLELPGLPPLRDKHGEDVTDWLAAGHTVDELVTLAEAAPGLQTAPEATTEPAAEPRITITADDGPRIAQRGDAYVLAWTHDDGRPVAITLSSIREHSDGVHAEYTVTLGDCEPIWGRLNLASTAARVTLVKALDKLDRTIDWGPRLDRACRETAAIVRKGSPAVPVTPQLAVGERHLIVPICPLGETAVVTGDGGSGKTTLVLALVLAALNGKPLPGGILAARRIKAALFLDYETTQETVEEIVYLLCQGQGWDATGLHYKAMTAPLADQIAAVKADVARLGAELVATDSLAPASGTDPEGANAAVSFHTALRSLGPSVTKIVTAHVNAVAASRRGARPASSAACST